MYTTTMTQPDPQRLMDQFVSWEVSSKENKWLGRNITRWRNEEYDRLWKAADSEMDAVKRAAMFVRMNDLLYQNVVVIPVLWRSKVTAVSLKLRDLDISGWDSDLSNLANWYREA
jgi:peptide/nickel transport system substrate-binding protein